MPGKRAIADPPRNRLRNAIPRCVILDNKMRLHRPYRRADVPTGELFG